MRSPRHQICCVPHDSSVKTSKLFVRTGEHGVHAVASQNINAGTVVLQCLPIAHSVLIPPGVTNDDDTRKRCTRCFFRKGESGSSDNRSRFEELKRCSKCKIAYYCSRSCQAEDWTIQHKLECQYYLKKRKQSSAKMIATCPEEDAIPLLLRTFAALKNLQTNSVDSCDGHSEIIIKCGREHFSSLAVSLEYLDDSVSKEMSTGSSLGLAKECMIAFAERDGDAASDIWGYNCDKDDLNEAKRLTLDLSIQRALNAFQKNNFGIVDSLHAAIGEGVYPCAAILNHSCHPNCILRYQLGAPQKDRATMYHPPILQIIACRDIQEGEELTHSYVDLSLPTQERQSRLFRTHGFECKCSRCNNEHSFRMPNNIAEWAIWPLEQKMKLLKSTSEGVKDLDLVDISLDVIMIGQKDIGSSMEYKNLIFRSQHLQEQSTLCMLEGDSRGELSNLHTAIELFMTHGISPLNFKLYSLRCSYLSALLASGDIFGALEQCEHIVAFLAVTFSHVGNHPLLGLQLYTLGDLYSAAADTGSDKKFEGIPSLSLKEKALLAYSWARDIMLITHGPDNVMVRSLRENISS